MIPYQLSEHTLGSIGAIWSVTQAFIFPLLTYMICAINDGTPTNKILKESSIVYITMILYT